MGIRLAQYENFEEVLPQSEVSMSLTLKKMGGLAVFGAQG
jgi:hypothetical protein